MRVNSVQFVVSALDPRQYPRDRRPEIAFVGRSNVGKSSLLNTLLGRKGLAKTSSTPGKTQTLNFFDVNERFYFVDLPGYGFAKAPKSMKDAWNQVLAEYLRTRDTLRLVVSLVDARHKPSALDVEMLHLLEEAEVPTLVVATKIDKLKRSQRNPAFKSIRETLDLHDDMLVLPFSSETKEGVKELWQVIAEQL
ncbi:MAG: ribosome biogenesis GTP-binding protein YihA/YsxC [Candidatus Hydrogenedentes bacterium]|nr:ribosome biogenesis GTP-binding protein YihA/YsxC [Candidatus Hydrogenedentota bacterium]